MICFLIFILSMMVPSYSAYMAKFEFDGTATITSKWDVEIVDVEVVSFSDGCDAGTPTYTNNSVSFDAKLNKPGDSITYKVSIENKGTLDAVLKNFIFKTNNDSIIKFETTMIDEKLKAGNLTTFNIIVTYDNKITEMPESTTDHIVGIIEYGQE